MSDQLTFDQTLSMTSDDIDQICLNSFRNFHSRGLDYLCLKRSPELTLKIYFFDGDVSTLPEVVIPHDHRYDFNSTVLSGCVENRTYALSSTETDTRKIFPKSLSTRAEKPYERFEYRTPLNGGDGFKWVETVSLYQKSACRYRSGESYLSANTDIHTLQIHSPDSVLLLEQFHDVVPLDVPTSSYRLGSRELPNLSGLYDKMTPDHALMRLRQLDRMGFRW